MHRDSGKNRLPAKPECKILHSQYIVSADSALRKLKMKGIRFVLRFFQSVLQPVDHLLLAGNNSIIAFLIPLFLLCNDPLQSADFFAGVGITAFGGDPRFLLQRKMARIIAVVCGQMVIFHFKGTCGDAIQKIAVV